jgi:hypothetical protein
VLPLRQHHNDAAARLEVHCVEEGAEEAALTEVEAGLEEVAAEAEKGSSRSCSRSATSRKIGHNRSELELA